jgi:aldose 1-epimerase
LAKYAVARKVVEGHTTFHLIDLERKMDFGLVPDIGNLGYSFKIGGREIIRAVDSFEPYIKDRALGRGIPFMAPFANRIDHDYYYFEGKKYLLNDSLGNFLREPPKSYPIHGLLAYDSRWQVIKTGASKATGAYITSRLEFYTFPDLMAQFPFAHIYEITYRLKGAKLQSLTEVTNMGRSSMPVHFGYHPYFVPDGPRKEWRLHVAANKHWLVNDVMIPTGRTEAAEKYLLGATQTLTLGETFIDGGFTDLQRDRGGLARFWIEGQTMKVQVAFDKGFNTAIVFAPLHTDMACIEPQTGPTNVFNLVHEGKLRGLVILKPGQTFRATYWIIPESS